MPFQRTKSLDCSVGGLIHMDENLSAALSAHSVPADSKILEFQTHDVSVDDLRLAFTRDIAAVFLKRGSADEEPIWRCWPLAFDLGFVPVACNACGDLFLRSSLVTDTRRLGGRSRGRVTMSTLGSNGRFANQIFQHAYVKLYGLRHGCGVELPEWDGTAIYGAGDPLPETPLPAELRYYAFDDDDLELWKLEAPPIDVDFWGYFQELPDCWKPHRDLLRRLYALRQTLATELNQRISDLTDGGKRPLIAIHVRRGDYVELHQKGLPWYRPAPEIWYAEWLDTVFSKHPDAVLYIATDAPADILPVFARFGGKSLRDIQPVKSLPSAMLDFEVMRRADQLAVCNSSFSRMAAILAAEAQRAAIADFEEKRLAPFEAWSFERFWSRFEGRGLAKQSPILGYGDEARRQRNLTIRRQAATGLKAYNDLTKLWGDYTDLSSQHQQLEDDRGRLLSQIAEASAQALALTERLQHAHHEAADLHIAIRAEIIKRPSRIAHRALFRSLYLGARIGRRMLGSQSGFSAAYLTPMIDALREYRHREALGIGKRAATSIVRRLSGKLQSTCSVSQPPRAKTPPRPRSWQEPGHVFPVVATELYEALPPDGADLAEQIEASKAEVLAISTQAIDPNGIAHRLALALMHAEHDIAALVFDTTPATETLFVRRAAVLQALPANKRLKRGLSSKVWIARLREALPVFHVRNPSMPGSERDDGTALGPHHPLFSKDPIAGAERLEAALLALPARQREGRRPHCLVIVPWLPIGGSEVVLLDVLSRLAKDWRVSIVTTLPNQHAMRALFAPVAQDILHAGDLLDADRLVAVIAALAQSEGSSAVLTSNSSLAYERASELKARLPRLSFIDILHNHLAEGHIRNATRYSAAFRTHVAVSSKVRDSLIARGVRADRVRLIPNGIDTDLFQPADDRVQLKADAGAAEGEILLGFVGRLSGEKRPGKFLDVVSRLSGKLPTKAVMIGDGDELPDLQKRIVSERLPVRIISKVDRGNLPRLYAAFDMLVMTSSIEGMPLVMLEALACGTPVASTRVGDVDRIIRDGANGFLASVDRVEVLAEDIRGAAKDGRLAAMRAQARESLMTSGMTREAMLSGYVEVLSEVLADQPRD
jgi:glycosyltransferase involved in cell wall biosynthesis